MSTSESDETTTQVEDASPSPARSQAPRTEAERKKRLKARAKRRKELEKQRAKAARAEKQGLSERDASKKSGLFGGLFGRSTPGTGTPDDATSAQPQAAAAPERQDSSPNPLDAQADAPNSSDTSGADLIPEPSLPADVQRELAEAMQSTSASGTVEASDTPVTSPADDSPEMPDFVASRHPNPITIAATATLQVMEAGGDVQVPDAHAQDPSMPDAVAEVPEVVATTTSAADAEQEPELTVERPAEPASSLAWESNIDTRAVAAEEPQVSAHEAGVTPDSTTDTTPQTVESPAAKIATSSAPKASDLTAPKPIAERPATPPRTPAKPRVAQQERLRPRARTRPSVPSYANEIREREREIRDRIDAKRRELDALFNSTER